MGLGGYSHAGFAWRFYLPEHLKFRASDNLLEHIASIITPWIDIIKGRLKPGDYSVSMMDSSTSEVWSCKTNFKEDGEDPIQATIRLEVARGHARSFMDNNIKDYSQWFPNKENDVSGALSQDNDRRNEELIQILKTFFPSEIPLHFRIVPLPKKIVLWLTSLLARLLVKQQMQGKHMREKLGHGSVEKIIATQLASSAINSLRISTNTSGSRSSSLSPWLCVKDNFQYRLMTPWLKAQSEVSFHMWHRPFDSMEGQTQQDMKMESLGDFYLACIGYSRMGTQIQPSKKPCQISSYEN